VESCPAGIDIPGFLRRMEAKNYTGAARLIREKNPFGEVCGMLCTPGRTCQKSCYRRDFAVAPVRIAELQRWVCAEAGEDGWIKQDRPPSGPKVAVMGGGPSAMSCAYYLTLTGCKVNIFAPESQPGGALWTRSASDPMLQSAVQREVQGVISIGIGFEGDQQLGVNLDLKYLLDNFRAVFLADAGLKGGADGYETWLGTGWRNALDQQSGKLAIHPGVFVGNEFMMNGVSVVEAVARGRKAACSIDQFLNPQT
jgi:formate dehydrogenase major subunit